MLKNYLKIAVRNLLKYRAYSLINIMGLAIGMACCVLILLYVRDELDYDNFYENGDRLYRVHSIFPGQGGKLLAVTPPPAAPAIGADIPEIEAATRILAYFEAAIPGRAAVIRGEHHFFERFFWADTSFFKVFSFPLLQGNPDTAFADPYSVVITEGMAQKYFGDENAMDKVLTIDTGYTEEDYKVTGVMRNFPGSSHFHPEVLASFGSLENLNDERVMMDDWWDSDCYTYVLLKEGTSPEDVEGKMPQLIDKHTAKGASESMNFKLMPISDIHLHSRMFNEIEPNSDILYVYIFSVVAFVILLVACINFMNLATARSANRAREVGMRKVVGAYRSQLILQFIGESMLISLVSLIVAIILAKIGLPIFNAFVNKEMSLAGDSVVWLSLVGMTLLVGLIAGSYPALFLSSFRPINVLGGTLASGTKSVFFRKFLVVFQFVVSVILIIGTFIIFDQLNYMRNFDMGIDMDRVVVMPVRDSTLKDRYLSVKDRVAMVPNVEGNALSALYMGKEAPNLGSFGEGGEEWRMMGSFIIDQDWIDFYGLEFITGRNFDRALGDADLKSFILTESGARELGWTPEEAIGKRLAWMMWRQGRVIGVVKDFHYQPLRYSLQPGLLLLRPIAYHFLAVRIGPGDLGQTLKDLGDAWGEIFPNRAFEYFFLKDRFEQLYRTDQQMGEAVGFFSLVAVFLGCLGLLGLASFTAEQRTKEIGVRKVLGASTAGVLLLLSKEFTKLILIAVVIACPVAYLVLTEWLKDFAYRAEIDWLNFALGAVMAFVIAGLTVGFQAIKAALTNPADALRYE
ncbi:MAG: FtsX-like permease family protein [bacterium]|nr:FtsX-like permease family protein [bacterium]